MKIDNKQKVYLSNFSQVYHDLLRSEEQFVSVLRSAVDDFIKVRTLSWYKKIVAVNLEKKIP